MYMRYWKRLPLVRGVLLVGLLAVLGLLVACTSEMAQPTPTPRVAPPPTTVRSLEERVAELEALHPTPTPTATATPTPTDEQFRRAEFHSVAGAVKALRIQNAPYAIPSPFAGNDAPCTTGTQNMAHYIIVGTNNLNETKYCYKVDSNGTVHQYNTAGVEQTP